MAVVSRKMKETAKENAELAMSSSKRTQVTYYIFMENTWDNNKQYGRVYRRRVGLRRLSCKKFRP